MAAKNACHKVVAGCATSCENGHDIPTLFKPLRIRGVEFQNRIFLSPLCQYSAEDGVLTQWHFAHLGGIICRGPGLTMVEATAVSPQGRITPQDVGLWSDGHIEGLAAIVNFAHTQGQKIGIQLSHAGRKGSTTPPWVMEETTACTADGGWPHDVWGPSPIRYAPGYPLPKELNEEMIDDIVQAFGTAARRVVEAGFDVLEIQSGHGYLLHSFLSPVSNKREDRYGGSFENRTRLTVDVVKAAREHMPPNMPLFLRISASDCLEESMPDEPSWRVEDTIRLAPILAAHGVDLLDVSSGFIHPRQKLRSGPAFQAHLSEAVKAASPAGMVISTVGKITTGSLAQHILDQDQADVVFIGKQFLENPSVVWAFAKELGVNITLANQIGWVFQWRGKRRDAVNRRTL
ncbi:FMN-linked oxidoreductase [Mycena belliarum]|uniref:FMN-linked oxidoreductase n=1 Tax=Mycena belliarum TaxID=1033014 RepID=A0AAD6XI61_9AGAR|nr:FMN-linked oxidoreductase [Mycena belliae]